MQQTAILLLHCPDKLGIITEITKFITDNNGNIVYLDQYVDKIDGRFFMRVEWELEKFAILQKNCRNISIPSMDNATTCSSRYISTTRNRAWLCS